LIFHRKLIKYKIQGYFFDKTDADFIFLCITDWRSQESRIKIQEKMAISTVSAGSLAEDPAAYVPTKRNSPCKAGCWIVTVPPGKERRVLCERPCVDGKMAISTVSAGSLAEDPAAYVPTKRNSPCKGGCWIVTVPPGTERRVLCERPCVDEEKMGISTVSAGSLAEDPAAYVPTKRNSPCKAGRWIVAVPPGAERRVLCERPCVDGKGDSSILTPGS